MLPLHLAAQHGASVAVVGRLLQHHPHAAAAKDNSGRLPLHVALERKAPEGVVRDGWGRPDKLPLHLALEHEAPENEAPEGVVLAIIDAHPQVRRHAESRRTKEFSPLGPRAAVSWPRAAWGLLEPSRRGGENVQNTGKNGGKWARYGLKRVNEERKGGITWEGDVFPPRLT